MWEDGEGRNTLFLLVLDTAVEPPMLGGNAFVLNLEVALASSSRRSISFIIIAISFFNHPFSSSFKLYLFRDYSTLLWAV